MSTSILGTSSIVHETTHQPLLSTLSAVVETVLKLRSLGHKVILVSSGAIGVGLKRMEIASRPKVLAKSQALAAIGQGRLIALWDSLFSHLGQPIAQILLTRGDISDRTRYLNAVNTLTELLTMGVVPIVNENDTISVSEIKFGDNDTLSAITSGMIHADYLFLLTDVDGLYTANPRKDPNARAIEVVDSVQAIRSQVSTKTLGSHLGTGGMESKLIAAEIAAEVGVATVICSSKYPERILDIIEYDKATRSTSLSNPATPREPGSGRASPAPLRFSTPGSSSGSTSEETTPGPRTLSLPSIPTPPPERPPHTLFTPSATPMRDLKSWTSHTLWPAGSVVIDAGAHAVLSRRESGGRLLPAGVVGIIGTFASGQAVRIVIRRRSGMTQEPEQMSAISMSTTIMRTYTSDSPFTEPSTPALQPSASLTSSISTIETLPRAMSIDSNPVSNLSPLVTTWEDEPRADDRDDFPTSGADWEIFEVGRGLANYNSAQIKRVKGAKSTNIPHVLGYADSEYVVENITIRIPP